MEVALRVPPDQSRSTSKDAPYSGFACSNTKNYPRVKALDMLVEAFLGNNQIT